MSEGEHLQLERLVFFSDAVFAIAITLLIIELRVPEIDRAASEAEALQALLRLTTQFLGFVISFFVIGAYWIGHSRTYRLIQRVDEGLLVRNLLFLMSIAFIPFPTAFVSEYAYRPTAVILYATSLGVIGLLHYWQWRYASGGGRLLASNTPARLVRYVSARTLITPAVCVLVIALAFVAPRQAMSGLFGIFLFNRLVDRRFRDVAATAAGHR